MLQLTESLSLDASLPPGNAPPGWQSFLPSSLTTCKDEQGDFKNVTKITSGNRWGTISRRTVFSELIKEESGVAVDPSGETHGELQALTSETEPAGSCQEYRAAHARLGPVLSEITESFDHNINGGRVHSLNILQRPKRNIPDTFAV